MYCRTVMIVFLGLIFASVCGLMGMETVTAAEEIGKPVRIVSLCFQHGKSLDEIIGIIDEEGARGVDLICLPEAWRGQTNPETLDGETITAVAGCAMKHHCYIVCPIDRREGEYRFNSSVLIDREGNVACVYDKIFPYWTEFDINPPVEPSHRDVQVFETDFGKVGLAICYDAKFPEVWQRLRDRGAELVVWSSAYSGATELQAFALMHHYYIVTSTWTGDCLVYDMTGACLRDEKDRSGFTIARFTLDMDRMIYHFNFNLEKRDKLLRERGDDIIEEVNLPREEWFVLRARRPGISVRALARQYGLEELRDYKDRSRRQIDEKRGFGFADTFGGYPGHPK
ncbi:carbon-nitrogen hydrolase family protein [bacterium]|nr:carbon-nitrogen hydrolase family protein [bacterium]